MEAEKAKALDDYSVVDLVRILRRSISMGIHVSMPGTVKSYYAPENGQPAMVDVQPDLQMSTMGPDGEEVVEDRPVVPHAVVQWMAFGGFAISGEVKEGDTGLLVFCDRSLDRWIDNGGPVDPEFAHAHMMQDAIFFPGLRHGKNFFEVPAGKLRVGKQDGSAMLEIDGASGDVTVLSGGKVNVEGAEVTVASSSSIKLDGAQVTLTAGSDLATFLTQLHIALSNWAVSPPPPVPDSGAALKTLLAAFSALQPPTSS